MLKISKDYNLLSISVFPYLLYAYSTIGPYQAQLPMIRLNLSLLSTQMLLSTGITLLIVLHQE